MAFEAKNRNFSLTELIAAIAVLAALAAIICIQVLPPLERAKEARDRELLESYLNAAAEAFADIEVKSAQSEAFLLYVYTGSYQASTEEARLQEEIRKITGYLTIEEIRNAALSKKGKRITEVIIIAEPCEGSIRLQAVSGENQAFDEADLEYAF